MEEATASSGPGPGPGSGSTSASGSGHHEHSDSDHESIVIYTGHLEPAFCATLALIFLCLAAVQALRAVLIRSKGKRIRQFMTKLLLVLVILSAVVRSVFFALMPVHNLDMDIYYLLWWVPEFLNISACFLYIRLWLRTYATTYHVGEYFAFRWVRRWMSAVQYSTIVALLLGQLSIWLAMLGTGNDRFDLIQHVDVYYLVFWEGLAVLTALAAFLSVRIILYRRRHRQQRTRRGRSGSGKKALLMKAAEEGKAATILNEEEEEEEEEEGIESSEDLSFPSNVSRVDVVLLFWLLARIWRLVDAVVCAKIGDELINTNAYWTYVGPFYFATEVAPGALFVFSRVLEMLDHGMVQYRKLEKANANTNSHTRTHSQDSNSSNSNPFLFGSRKTKARTSSNKHDGPNETTSLLSSVSEHPMVKNWIINYNELDMVELLGHGAGGEVWKAVYQDTVVAVKRLKKGLLESPRDLDNFCSEMKILSSLRHENVVSFYGACINPPHICIVSEYLQRKSLRAVLLDKHLTLSLSLRMSMMIDLCKALRFVHSNRIIHRDLKPENLMIGAHFNLKVGDFGSGTISPYSSDVKHSGYALSIAGTNKYMAPEVFQRKYSYPADVYSAGFIIWEVYTRAHLFDEPLNIDDLVVRRRRPKIPEQCPPVLANIISRSWDHDPHVRPTFAEILKLLKAWQAAGYQQDFEGRLPASPEGEGQEGGPHGSDSESDVDNNTRSNHGSASTASHYPLPTPAAEGSLNLDVKEEAATKRKEKKKVSFVA
ncbi:protein kinase [Balamuthia mandrillaris]